MKFYCPEPLASQPLYQLFYFRFSPDRKLWNMFGAQLPENYFETWAQYAAAPEEADAIVLPNNFSASTAAAKEYIARYAEIGERYKKPIYIFSCGDLTDTLAFDPRVCAFRYSLYKSAARQNDICAPTITEDLGRGGITLREKADIPTVSFCGKAEFSSLREALASWLRRIPLEIAGIFYPNARARIRGVFWRKRAVNACRRSSLLQTLFIIRKTFSGAAKTIELDPAQARQEFVDSLKGADFVLAPKGDGNYSNRFLEALSMGRIPVLIDTDTVLPFEDQIDYSKICIKVPMSRVKNAPQYIREFYDALTAQEWAARQELARETYEKYVRQDAFFREFFAKS